jgi:CBS domain-containing protein
MQISTILRHKGTGVETAPSDLPLRDVAQRLAGKGIGALVLVGEDKQVVGVVSEGDVVRAIAERGAAAFGVPARAVLTRSLVTCAPEDSIERAMSAMTLHRARHLPVLAGDALVGIVSLGDLVKVQLDTLRVELGVLRDFARMRR